MKVCIIGTAGHTNYVLDGVSIDSNSSIVGLAPGTENENIDGLVKKVNEMGHQPQIYRDYREMLDDVKPDVAAVASHFYKQASITLEAVKRGINVFAEKPLATTLGDLKRVKDAYESSTINLAAMFGIRYDPWFMTAWKLVQNGVIGKVRLMNAQKSYKLGTRAEFFKKRETYGGTIPWVGSHAVDWLYWFSGERFKSVYASHSSKYNKGHDELEVAGLIHFNFTNEVMGAVNIDYLRPNTAPSHGDDRIRIAGAEGVIEVRDEKVFLINNKGDGIQEINQEENDGIFADFLRQIRGEGKCSISAEDSFYITEACLRARQSADENKVVYF